MELSKNDYNLLVTDQNILRLTFLSSYGLSIITLITWIFGIIAVPISGVNAPDGGISYPYLDTIKQYPRDFIWQYLAMFMTCLYLGNL